MFSKKYSILISSLIVLLLIMTGCGTNSENTVNEVSKNNDNQNNTKASKDTIT
ncbi:hypothetical protein [Bacillus sp. OK048]|uniref:hypothetical protein n=1 Tax=Bacillus sp. OK048 TaxID=1882761 RepID=UPI00088D7346|nr:hypothetical protein [Bacillus sp. OK048]SDL95523.1 hypothetical protein SAMN05443253_101276 [Bacillus sp. OK048]